MDKHEIKLEAYTPDGEWPRCYYDQSLLCGESETGALEAYNYKSEEKKRLFSRSWHIADLCNCPSCPLRVALAKEVAIERLSQPPTEEKETQ